MSGQTAIRKILLYNSSILAGANTVVSSDAGLSTQGQIINAAEVRLLNIALGKEFAVILDTVTGTAPAVSVSYEVQAGVDDNWVTPSNSVIISNASAATAAGFQPTLAQFIRLTIANGSANTVAVKAYLMIQEEG